MGLGGSKNAQSSKQKKLKKRSQLAGRIGRNARNESPPQPRVVQQRSTRKRPTKREKLRELRDASDFPGMRRLVNQEACSLVPGEGILEFLLSGISGTTSSTTNSEENDAVPQQQPAPTIGGEDSSGFISLDVDDGSTELGQRFAQFEEQQQEEEEDEADEKVEIDESRIRNEFPCPWLDTKREPKETVGEHISAEVLDFLRYMSPTKAEIKKREDCVNRLRRVVKQLWPNATVSVFGSYATGMYLPDADIDVVILGDEMRYKIRSEMFRLGARLKSNRLTQNVNVISHARVPIIKYVEAGSGIAVDIAFSQSGGIETARRVGGWLDDNSALKPLAMVVRQFLKRRNLSDVATGGLGGYATICLVYSRMQQRLQDFTTAADSEGGSDAAIRNLGILLLDFFNYYGHVFDNAGQYVRPRPAPYCKPCSKRLNGSMATPQAAGLAIEDPSDTSNNISKASYNYPAVKRSFANAADYLKGLSLEWYNLSKRERAQISFLSPLVKFSGSEPRRSKVALERALSTMRLNTPPPQAPQQQNQQQPFSSKPPVAAPKTQSSIPQNRRSDSRTPMKNNPQVSVLEKGRGVQSYDPWQSASASAPEPSESRRLDREKPAPSEPSEPERASKRPLKPIPKDAPSKRRDKQPAATTFVEVDGSSSSDSEGESRTRLTSAQRRQFWSRKAGTLEAAEASS